MSAAPHYLWRQLNEKQRAELLAWRKARGYPWHSPPHRPNFGHLRFLISASCFEHRHYIGCSSERMDNFSRELLAVLAAHASQTFAWCVLPNHYHALLETPNVKALLRELGLLHGRTAHAWNGEEQVHGRKVFFRAVERAMRSDRHYWATLNYVHHNPVRHGYVTRWIDWPWSSATEYLAQTGVEEAKRIWQELSAARLREGLGRAGDVVESRVYAVLGVPPLDGLRSDAAPGRMNAELRTHVTPCAPRDFTPAEIAPRSV